MAIIFNSLVSISYCELKVLLVSMNSSYCFFAILFLCLPQNLIFVAAIKQKLI